MIRAIIFDCFGVLSSDGWLPFKKKYFGHDKALFDEAGDLNRQADAGLADYREYIQKIAQLAGVSADEARRAIEDNVADDELFDFIKENLKPRYKIGMLSNAGGNWLEKLFSTEQVDLFDAVSLSYATGVVKPHGQAYLAIAGQLGVEPEECIFVDDQERHCAGAREAGMRAILYEDFEQFKRELEALLAADKK